VFEKRQRFYTADRQHIMLERCTEIIRGCEVKYSFETECQLYGEPLIPNHQNQVDETKTPNTDDANIGDVSSSHSEALRIVVDVCQPKQNGNGSIVGRNELKQDDDSDGKNDAFNSYADIDSYKIKSDARMIDEVECMDISSHYGNIQTTNGICNKVAALNPLSCSTDVINIDDENEDCMESASPRNPGLLNWNTGEIQNMDNNDSIGVHNQCTIMDDEVHPISSEGYSETMSHSTAFSNSRSPCVVPVGSREYVEYDAV
jgi:hypothetical protein